MYEGEVIGLSKKVRKLEGIIRKLVAKEELDDGGKTYLKKIGINV